MYLVHQFESSSCMCNAVQDGVGTVLPARGCRPAIAAAHKAVQGLAQGRRVGEGAAGQDLPLQGAEPVLDRVQPGGVGRGEVEVEAGVGLPPVPHLAVFVGGVVVQDQVHLLGGEAPGQLAQEGQQFLVPVAPGASVVDLAGVEVQGRQQGQGAAADVVVGAGGGVAGRGGQARLRACQGLHLGLLVEGQSHDAGLPFFSSTATTSRSLASKRGSFDSLKVCMR